MTKSILPQDQTCRNSIAAFLVAALLILPAATNAQKASGPPPPDHPLTLGDCIALALQESPAVDASRFDVAAAGEEVRAAQGEAGRLSLAFVSSADYSVLPPLLRAYQTAYPQVAIQLQEATSDLQLDELLQGRIDAGLLIPPLPDKAKAALDYLPVLAEPLILAAPSGLDVLQTPGPVRLQDVPPLPLIIFPRAISPGLHDAIVGVFRAAGITPQIGQEAIQMQTIVSLVSAGMGIALVPQSVSNLMRPGVEYRPLHDATPLVETGLAWRRDNPSSVLQGFLALLRRQIDSALRAG